MLKREQIYYSYDETNKKKNNLSFLPKVINDMITK